MALDLRGIFAYWESIGVFDVVLPFLLIFAVSYSIFTTTKILGTANNKVAGIVSAMIGILFVQNSYLVGILQSFIPNVAMFIIVILMVFLVAGVFLGEKGQAKDWAFIVAAIASIVFVVLALGGLPGGYLPPWLYYYFDDQTIATLILVGVFVFIIWFVTKKPAQGKFLAGIEKTLKDLWGKD